MKSSGQDQQLTQYQTIKKHGYQLTSPLQFLLPAAASKTSIVKSLFKLFVDDSHQKSIFNSNAHKNCTILNQKIVIFYQSNKLIVIHYTLINDKLSVESKASFLLNQPIKRVVCAYYDSKFQKTQTYEYFAVQFESSANIALFKIDQLMIVALQHEINEKDQILAMRFISSTEIMVLLKNGQLNCYKIKQNKLRNAKVNLKIVISDDQILRNGEICTVSIENQVKILLFYLIYSQRNQKYQLNLKEFLKDSNNKLQEYGTFYDIFDCNPIQSFTDHFVIYTFGEGILIHHRLTIFVVQKRFGKYIKSDIISQLSNAKRIIFIDKKEHMFICSIGEGEIELWEVKMKDVGCYLQLLDVVEADGTLLAGKIIKAWIFIKSKKPQFVLMTDGGARKVDFYLTRKIDKLSKLTMRVRKQQDKLEVTNPDKTQQHHFASKLKLIEELSSKLGFNRKQFYLKLWHQSEKNSTHIIEFLLPCKDFKVIFNQITLFLRLRKLAVTQITRILKRIQLSLLEEMVTSLDLELIRQFLKTNFQRRKLKLYSGQEQLDFQKYQNIYESSVFDLIHKSIDLFLFPQKFKHDIVWKEQVIQQPVYLPYILKEFRLLILEDYPNFLLQMFKPYSQDLKKVIESYPYLLPQFPFKISIVRQQLVMLSNIYQEEKIEEHQYSWLSYIRQNQWERQSSSVDFLFRHLFKHHATSLISDKLRQFSQGNWCNRNKYSRHILLQSKKQQFQEKLPAISDGSSLLFLCEMANRVSLQKGRRSQSEDIVQAMHKHNNLPLPQYYRYRLFCILHHILIQQRLMHSSVTIIQLMQMKTQKMVACFFLGDRERIQLLFKIVAKHYSSKTMFNSIIQTFIISEQCSKVELEMLTNYIKKSGQDYQQGNQQLIGIVLKGFLKRIEIRQKDKAGDLLKLFRNITLSENLLITMAIFQSIKTECSSILKAFDLSNLTYDTIIYDPSKIISSITYQFFSSAMLRDKTLYIEQREVNLSFSQNLFVLVLYLKDKIYSFSEQMEIYLVFCEAILSWNQFDLLKSCFAEEIVIDEKQYFPQEFYCIVVDFMLNKYYQDETLIYNDETKEHILNLLSLIDVSSEIYVIQTAKMQFVDALQSLQQAVSVQYMQIIKQTWEKQEERSTLFHDIIDLFKNEIDFEVIMKLYSSLEKIRTGATQITIKTPQFIDYSIYICRKYVKAGQYELIRQVISFLNGGQVQYKAKYSVMTECFLQLVSERRQAHRIRHPNIKVNNLAQLNSCKYLIDYYISNYDNVQIINDFFKCQFPNISNQKLQQDQIEIDQALCFFGFSPIVSRKSIWEIIAKRNINTTNSYTDTTVSSQRKLKPLQQQVKPNSTLDSKTILFTYYFVCNVLKNYNHLFQMQQITFNHFENICVIEQLYKDETLRQGVNFKKIYNEYIKGLFKIYYLLTEDIELSSKKEIELPVLQKQTVSIEEKIKEIKDMGESKLILLISDLPLDKGSLDILRAMKKLIPIFQNSFIQEEKSQRQRTIKTVVQNEQPFAFVPLYFGQAFQRDLKQSVTQPAIPVYNQTIQHKNFKFLQFQTMKKQIASKSSVISQKMIIQKVLDQLENNINKSYASSSMLFQQKHTIKMHPVQQKNELIGNVLEDLSLYQSNQLLAVDLLDIGSIELDINECDEIKSLIESKEFQKIVSSYHPKIILKVLDTQFYQRAEVYNHASKAKKRINRSNTIKQSIQFSRIISLLQILDSLKLYNSTSKVRILRSCLMIVSSEELLLVQNHLLAIFKLIILLEVNKNIVQLIKDIFENVNACCAQMDLQKYKIIVKIIVSFLQKCKEETLAQHSFKTNPKILKSGHEAAELYLSFLIQLSQSAKSEDQKLHDLEQIMILLGKQQLLAIHQRLLTTLGEGDLYLSYLELIHKLYIGSK